MIDDNLINQIYWNILWFAILWMNNSNLIQIQAFTNDVSLNCIYFKPPIPDSFYFLKWFLNRSKLIINYCMTNWCCLLAILWLYDVVSNLNSQLFNFHKDWYYPHIHIHINHSENYFMVGLCYFHRWAIIEIIAFEPGRCYRIVRHNHLSSKRVTLRFHWYISFRICEIDIFGKQPVRITNLGGFDCHFIADYHSDVECWTFRQSYGWQGDFFKICLRNNTPQNIVSAHFWSPNYSKTSIFSEIFWWPTCVEIKYTPFCKWSDWAPTAGTWLSVFTNCPTVLYMDTVINLSSGKFVCKNPLE